jgi:CO/xanthine dehydrogenase FAD-binding subunit
VSGYLAAASVADAVDALARGARPVAGGTDLVVGARQGKAPLPGDLVAIHGLAELRAIEQDDGELAIGALATHEDVVAHPLVRSRLTALADASAIVGSHATRHVGTLGGNVMNGSPAMDTGAPLICLGAAAELRSAAGTRSLPLDELFLGPGRTAAEPGELLVSLRVPLPADGSGSCYVRLEYRRHMEIAVVGVCAAITVAAGRVEAARIAITALAPTIRRVPEAEAALAGAEPDGAAIAAAADAVAAASAPISDVRGGAGYRRAMARVIARRAIEGALARAGGSQLPIPASDALYGATEVRP